MTDAALDALLDASIGYADYADRPHEVRGRVATVTGHLLRLERTPLDPAEACIPVVYEGQVLDNLNRVYSFCLTEPPRPPFVPGSVGIRDGLAVRLRGVFMQVIAYENRQEPPRMIATPLLIGRRLEPIKRGAAAGTDSLSWPWLAILLVLGVVAAVALLAAARRGRLAPRGIGPDWADGIDGRTGIDPGDQTRTNGAND
jgi:hypothetical protein